MSLRRAAKLGTQGRVRSPIRPMKIVAIANQKGGVGKTTTAVNLGCALAERGQRILIVDLDPQANATSALAAADEILTPIQCEYFALEGLVKIVRVVEQVRDSGANDRIEIGGIVMTMFDSRTNLSAQVVAEVRKHFGKRVYQTVIPRTVRLSEAPSFGKSILEHDSHGAGAHAYRALAREFIKRHPSPTIARESGRTLESEIL